MRKEEHIEINTNYVMNGGLAIQPVNVELDLSQDLSQGMGEPQSTPTNPIPANNHTSEEQQRFDCYSCTVCVYLTTCFTYLFSTTFSSTNNSAGTSTNIGPYSETQTVGVSGGNLNTSSGSSCDCLGCYSTNNQQTSSFGADGISQSESNSVSCFGLESENSTNCSIGSDGCDCGYSCNNCGVGCGFDESISCSPVSCCSLFSCDVPTLPSVSCCTLPSMGLGSSCSTLFSDAGECLSNLPLEQVAEGTMEVIKGAAGCVGAVVIGVVKGLLGG